MKFGILLTTYNRPELLKQTLLSLNLQTYRNFKVYLIDNGSNPPVNRNLIPKELDINLIRFGENQGPEPIDSLLDSIECDYFATIADDDVWNPNTLGIINQLLETHSEIKIINTGFSTYNHESGKPLTTKLEMQEFDGNLHFSNSTEMALAQCRVFCIGRDTNAYVPRLAHPSTSFISMNLIRQTKKRQGALFIRPLGDVGFLGCLFNTDFGYYLDLPLAVIGRSKSNDSIGAFAGRRNHWKREVPHLEYTPLKGCSFPNMAVDTHLKVLKRNGFTDNEDLKIDPSFFITHMVHILTDNPWSDTTTTDFFEALPYAVKSLSTDKKSVNIIMDTFKLRNEEDINGIHLTLYLLISIKQKLAPLSFEDTGKGDLPAFENAVEFAKWQENNYIIPLLSSKESFIDKVSH